MMNLICIGLGIAVLIVAISAWFIPISEADYQKWRLVFAAGEGLAIACGLMLVVFGSVMLLNN